MDETGDETVHEQPIASVSPLPRAAKHTLARRRAAVLYRALVAAGEAGVSWRESWSVLHADEELVGDQTVHIGQVIAWMRSKGVQIDAFYERGETRFRLSTSGQESLE